MATIPMMATKHHILTKDVLEKFMNIGLALSKKMPFKEYKLTNKRTNRQIMIPIPLMSLVVNNSDVYEIQSLWNWRCREIEKSVSTISEQIIYHFVHIFCKYRGFKKSEFFLAVGKVIKDISKAIMKIIIYWK